MLSEKMKKRQLVFDQFEDAAEVANRLMKNDYVVMLSKTVDGAFALTCILSDYGLDAGVVFMEEQDYWDDLEEARKEAI